ncbi:MAG TPA: hypothetical protein ENK19_03330 [Acidobacteria bacterium]|nr:hypothetical protein [Acidobacteriota bacterium]
MELLRNGDMEALAAFTLERRGAVRHLLGRLWDADAEVRERAAEGIGVAAAQHPNLGLELLRRFDWALNDESATNGAAVLGAMAAVAVRSPEISRPFVGRIVAALGDPGLREPASRAVDRLEAQCPELLEPHRGELIDERPAGDAKDEARERGGRWDEN